MSKQVFQLMSKVLKQNAHEPCNCLIIPPVYEVYSGYIGFAFTVCLCVCV